MGSALCLWNFADIINVSAKALEPGSRTFRAPLLTGQMEPRRVLSLS